MKWQHFGPGQWPDSAAQLGMPDAAFTILTDARPRPSLHKDDEGMSIVLRAINFNDDGEPHEMVSLRCYLTETTLATFSLHELKSVNEARANLATLDNSDEIFIELVQNIHEKIHAYVNDLENHVDDLEESPSCDAHFSKDLMARCAYLRRFAKPQHDVLSALLKSERFAALQQLHNRSLRDLEALELVRERLGLLISEAHIHSNEKLNQRMYLLTIVTVVFASASLLAGLFGMNVGGMPLQDKWGFILTSLLIAAMSTAIGVAVYRKLK